ncbi:MAG: hypothetical protein HQM00_00745 [Magnetococcales bacterium]|nr:hypothetical protein [Magnetococcales bacterium]
MAENEAALGSNVIEVPLWWRKISDVELEAVVCARRAQTPTPGVHPGMGAETRRILAKEESYYAERGYEALARRWRLVVLETFNAKLNRVMERVQTGADRFIPHPMQLHASGEGLTFWISEGEVAVGDLLELRFLLFPEQPMPMHTYCRVRRMRREWSGSGVRVECIFELLKSPEAPPKPISAPNPPQPDRSSAVIESLPPEPLLWEPGDPISSIPEPVEPSIWETPPAIVRAPAAPSVESPRPAVARVAPVVSAPKTKAEQTLAAAQALLDADPRAVAAHVVPHKVPEPKVIVPKVLPPPPVVAQGGTKRQDFRINDNLPLTWKVLTQKSFDQAVAYFHDHREFPMRERVARQKRLLAEVDVQLKLLKQLNVKARRPVVWFREFLDRQFRQANSENEEEYFQSVLYFFFNLIKELTKRPPGSMTAAQVVSLIKEQVDLQMSRDLVEVNVQKLPKAKLEEDLTEIKRQINKLLGELRASASGLYEKLNGFREVISMMDLSMQDPPKQFTPEGDAVFTVNLSATGVAWKTVKDRVFKGDLIEVRLGVDPEGSGLEPVWAYGRVVVVQEPDETGKRRVASYFEHMSPMHREKLQAHMVRRQRAELTRRANAP